MLFIIHYRYFNIDEIIRELGWELRTFENLINRVPRERRQLFKNNFKIDSSFFAATFWSHCRSLSLPYDYLLYLQDSFSIHLQLGFFEKKKNNSSWTGQINCSSYWVQQGPVNIIPGNTECMSPSRYLKTKKRMFKSGNTQQLNALNYTEKNIAKTLLAEEMEDLWCWRL